MHSFFVVTHQAGITLHSFVKGFSGHEKIQKVTLSLGDGLEVTNEGRYVTGHGWFISVLINQKHRLYLSMSDLEVGLKEQWLMSVADAVIKLNEWHHQLDQALDQYNEEWFKFVSRKIVRLQTSIAGHA